MKLKPRELISKNGDNITVWNDRILVIASMEKYRQSGRAGILSDAMMSLGNASEFELLNEEKGDAHDKAEVRRIAIDVLVSRWLSENSKYQAGEVISRKITGRVMTQTMQNEYECALGYASGQLDVVDEDKLMDSIHQEKMRSNKKIGLVTLKSLWDRGSGDGEKAILAATETVSESYDTEVNYRRNRAAGYRNGIQSIEIIGVMPDCIGTSRFQQQKGAN